jgi:16S rRNA (adenine1518-N6/adenine1519-N6)-dimethyltransferase
MRDLRIIGNLPYNISTPLLFHLAAFAPRIIDCHFMLQKEVVARMVAAPGNKDYGRLSVALQYRFEMESVLDVPPEAFDPPPKVESAVVRMRPKPLAALGARDEQLFAGIVTQAFSQRRKTLRNTLKGRVSEAQFSAGGIDPGARAEEIDVARFVALANLLAPD